MRGGQLGHDLGLGAQNAVQLVAVRRVDGVLQHHEPVAVDGRYRLGDMLVGDEARCPLVVGEADRVGGLELEGRRGHGGHGGGVSRGRNSGLGWKGVGGKWCRRAVGGSC